MKAPIYDDVLCLEDEGSVVDFLDVDPNLGTLEEWNSLVAQLQQRNIKVGLFREVKMDVKIIFLVDQYRCWIIKYKKIDVRIIYNTNYDKQNYSFCSAWRV